MTSLCISPDTGLILMILFLFPDFQKGKALFLPDYSSEIDMIILDLNLYPFILKHSSKKMDVCFPLNSEQRYTK